MHDILIFQTNVSMQQLVVAIRQSPELEWIFDKLILIAISAQPYSFGIPDVKEYVLSMKEIEESSKLQSRLLSNLEKVSA